MTAEKPAEAKRYFVIFRLDARYMAEVIAHDLDEAKDAAERMFGDADFGAATDIDGEPVIIEDEDGNYVWEKCR